MTQTWIKPDRLFDGQTVLDDVALRMDGNVVAEIGKAPKDCLRVAGCLTAGFIDVQVNGGGGVMLNSDPTPEAIRTIAAAHRNHGTTGILPTVITDHPDILAKAAEAAIAAKGQQGVLGLHIEGPHIALARRGTHNPDFVRPMDQSTRDIVGRLRDAGITVMITLAPEAATLAQIAALADMGAIVSIGHTDATADQVEAAIAAGARCATHLFNAMSPMTSRAPGAVGAVLNASIPFGLICDGYHVDDRMLKLALRAATAQGLAFSVSDAMATIDGPDHFLLYGQDVRLKEGRLVNAEGNLAGAHITQAQSVRRLVTEIGVAPADALGMAITTPATLIGRPDLATPLGRNAEDLLLLDDDFAMTGTLAAQLGADGRINAAE